MRLPMNTSLAMLKPSGIRRINALAAQHPGCIALALGEPDFPTPDVISAEVIAALDRGDTHYPPNNGRPALREALSAYMGDAGLTFSADEVILTDGATEALSATFMAMLNPGDEVIIFDPVDLLFGISARYAGATVVYYSPKHENGHWDFSDLESYVTDKTRMIGLCNPHNPLGLLYTEDELRTIATVAAEHDLWIMNDEIWSDIILEGYKHIPTQSVSDWARQNTVAVYAPSKTFNLAGLVGSYHIIYNKYLRDRVVAKSSKPHYNDMNVLSMHALIGAYKPEGYTWVDELRQVITGNVDYACEYIRTHFEGVEVSRPQGTYMLFLDCTDWCKAHGKTIEDVEHACWDVGAAIQDGTMFFGPCHLRMNLASPRSRIEEAFHRMDKYVFNA